MAISRQRTFKVDFDLFNAAVHAQVEELQEELGNRMVEHVWTAYDRPTTGRGFTNRTFDLRRSIRARVEALDHKIRLRMSANTSYAGIVESIKSGEYAYLGPTMEDMLPVAEQMIRDRLRVETIYKDRMGAQRSRMRDLLAKGRAAEKAGL